MLAFYIMEVAKMDQEIATVLRKKPTIKQIGKTGNVNKMRMGKIDSKYNIVMFTRGEGQKFVFILDDKTPILHYMFGAHYWHYTQV